MAEAFVEARLETFVIRVAFEKAEWNDCPLLKRPMRDVARRIIHPGRRVVGKVDVGIELTSDPVTGVNYPSSDIAHRIIHPGRRVVGKVDVGIDLLAAAARKNIV